MSANDVGKTFTVSSGTEFDQAVAFLTNGVNDPITSTVLFPPGPGSLARKSPEALRFFGDPTGVNGIDFQGFSIEAIRVTINSLTFDTPGQNPSNDGRWTDMEFRATVNIEGANAVPEPASVLLFSSGLIGLIFHSRVTKIRNKFRQTSRRGSNFGS